MTTTPSLRYRVISGPLSVRATPSLSGQRVGELPVGAEIVVDPASRTQAEGFVWWRHSQGWSAERHLTNTTWVFMEATPASADDAPPAEASRWRVVSGPVAVRATPGLAGARIGELPVGAIITVEPGSRQEVNNFIWWKHSQGWSAQRHLTNENLVFMEPVAEEAATPGEPVPPPPAPVPPPAPEDDAPKPGEPPVRFYRVVNGPLSIREMPTTSARRVGELPTGAEITVQAGDRAQADNLIWWRHSLGWSAQRTVDSRTVFMERIPNLTPPSATPEPNGEQIALPDGTSAPLERLFVRSPLDFTAVQWIQYFGNTQFAHRIWARGDFWYRYSQSLHGGFDYGNAVAGTPIYAGLSGTVVAVFRNSSTYAPNYVQVSAGGFLIIYGHILNPPDFRPGDTIRPDTVVGTIDHRSQQHLHLEVRLRTWWIINPLLVMTDEVRDPILRRWGNHESHFFRSASWSQWQTPFDQPVLRLSGPVIGPHAR